MSITDEVRAPYADETAKYRKVVFNPISGFPNSEEVGNKQADTITVLGVTLGEALSIPECRVKNIYGTTKSYDPFAKNCYTTSDWGSGGCLTRLEGDLSFYTETFIILENRCNLRSRVLELQTTFKTDDFSKMFELAENKFGTPTRVDESMVQNKMGAKFQQIQAYWSDIKGFEIYIARLSSTVDKGMFVITHPGRVKKENIEKRKGSFEDKLKF